MALNPTTLRVESELNTFLTGVTDAQTRAITAAWVDAWDSVVRELEAATSDLALAAQSDRITRTQILRSQRATAALESTKGALEYAALTSEKVVSADVLAVLQQAMESEEAMIASQLTGVKRAELSAALIRADEKQIGELVMRSTQQITALSLPLAAQTYDTVRRELLKGIALGTNPRTAARRMVAAAEDHVNFGLSRALTIARTEMLDAARAAAQAVDKANADVLAGWVWVAHLDQATCRSCVAQHGELHPIDEPGPWDHQNGRCARVPKTKSWKELGFDGIDDPPDQLPNADEWFAKLRPEQQRKMLGEKGFAAWKEGRYPRSAWSSKRTTTGWRDSYGPSRPPLPGQS